MMLPCPATLGYALAEPDESNVGSVLLWGLVLLALLAAMFVAVSLLRRWLQAPDATAGTGFSLGDLRELRHRGQMSDEEFERAKEKIVVGTQAAFARQAAAAKQAREAGPRPRGFELVQTKPENEPKS